MHGEYYYYIIIHLSLFDLILLFNGGSLMAHIALYHVHFGWIKYVDAVVFFIIIIIYIFKIFLFHFAYSIQKKNMLKI